MNNLPQLPKPNQFIIVPDLPWTFAVALCAQPDFAHKFNVSKQP
jgi:hypothetical protein